MGVVSHTYQIHLSSFPPGTWEMFHNLVIINVHGKLNESALTTSDFILCRILED